MKSVSRKRQKLLNAIATTACLLLFSIMVLINLALPDIEEVSAKYVSEIKQDIDLIINPIKPTFASNTSWYRGETDKTTITSITFAENDYVPSSYDELFYGDANNEGTIKCYVLSDKSLIISGNGWNNDIWDDNVNTVYANASSSSMFKGFSSITVINNLDRLNVGNVTSFNSMFSGCSALKAIDLSSWDTNKVKNTSNMFENCKNLESIGDLSNWSTSLITNMSSMFKSCESLKQLNVSSWTFIDSGVNTYLMFYGCKSLLELDLSTWNIKTTSMSQMFHSCAKLKTLDLSGFDTSSVTSTDYLFQGSTSLEKIIVSDKFDISAVKSSTNMFGGGLNSLTGCHGTTLAKTKIPGDNSNLTVKYACIDTTNKPGYFTGETITITYHNKENGNTYEQYVLPNNKDYLIANTFTKEGYLFKEWNTKEDGTGDSYSDGQVDVEFAKNIDLYAIWKENKYTVSFDLDGGSMDVESIEVDYDETYGELPTPTKTGYKFMGWHLPRVPEGYREVEYIENTGKEWIDTDVNGNNDSLIIDANIYYSNHVTYGSFYGNYVSEQANTYRLILRDSAENVGYFGSNTVAGKSGFVENWAKNKWHTIKQYKQNGYIYFKVDENAPTNRASEVGQTNNTDIALFASSVNKPTQVLMRIGMFKMTDSQGVLRDYVPCYDETNKKYGLYDLKNKKFYGNQGDGAFTGGNDAYNFVDEDSVVNTSKDHTLYAIWKQDPITITYHINNGTEDTTTQTVLRNDSITLSANTFVNDGYTFAGWSTYADGSGNTYSDKQDNVAFADDIDLYAKWTKATYTVKFNAGEGEVEVDSKDVIYSEQYGDLPNATREGYKFVGWSLQRLPDEYIEATYIENHGNQQEYIDTGVSGNNNNLVVEAKIYYSTYSSYAYFYGNYIDEQHDAYRLLLQNSDNDKAYSSVNIRAGSSKGIDGWTKNQWHTIKQYRDNSYFYTIVDGGEAQSLVCASGTVNNNSIGLFTKSTTIRDYTAIMRLGMFRMSDGSTIIRDFVPCYNTIKNEYGLYDLANDKYYGNDGANSFIGGEEAINPITSTDVVTMTRDHTLHAIWEEIG